MDTERSSFIGHWRELSEYVLPRRSRFDNTDVNRGDKRTQKIYDSTATIAARTLESGMMSGMTSPARPWFRLSLEDEYIAQDYDVKLWLEDVTRLMYSTFIKSNLYTSLPAIYGDLGTFGTAAMLVEEDMDTVLRCYTFPIGSYMIANGAKLKVEVFARDFRMTCRQIVDRFGRSGSGGIDWSKISSHVKSMWENGQTEQWVDVRHIIKPNDDYSPGGLFASQKKYVSIYYERGVSGSGRYDMDVAPEHEKYLQNGGYDYFPVLAPRWRVTAEDVYATSCPGMEALPDIKQLQKGEKLSLRAIDKMVDPPMIAPASLKSVKTSLLPGDVTFADERSEFKGFRPIHDVSLRLDQLEAKQEQVRMRIKRVYFEDLFLMLAQSDRREITAREIEERHQEKLWALGPILEQANESLYDPLVDIGFFLLLKQGRIPRPPDIMQGLPLKVEYISVMAQAQKLVGLSGIERFSQFVSQAVATTQDPAVLDGVDIDRLIQVYADSTGVPPDVLRSQKAVTQIRSQRARAQQQANTAQAVQVGAKAARDLAKSPMDEDNALVRLTERANAGALTEAVA